MRKLLSPPSSLSGGERELDSSFGAVGARWISEAEKAIDPRYVVPIAASLQIPDAIAALLTSRSGEMVCWTMSENPDWDAKSEILSQTLHRVVGSGFASFISCDAGKLAYFEGEGPSVRFILRRTNGP